MQNLLNKVIRNSWSAEAVYTSLNVSIPMLFIAIVIQSLFTKRNLYRRKLFKYLKFYVDVIYRHKTKNSFAMNFFFVLKNGEEVNSRKRQNFHLLATVRSLVYLGKEYVKV